MAGFERNFTAGSSNSLESSDRAWPPAPAPHLSPVIPFLLHAEAVDTVRDSREAAEKGGGEAAAFCGTVLLPGPDLGYLDIAPCPGGSSEAILVGRFPVRRAFSRIRAGFSATWDLCPDLKSRSEGLLGLPLSRVVAELHTRAVQTPPIWGSSDCALLHLAVHPWEYLIGEPQGSDLV